MQHSHLHPCTLYCSCSGLQHQPESQLWGRKLGSPLAGSEPLHQAILVPQVLLNLLTHVEDGAVTAGTQHTVIIRLVKLLVSGNLSMVFRFTYLTVLYVSESYCYGKQLSHTNMPQSTSIKPTHGCERNNDCSSRAFDLWAGGGGFDPRMRYTKDVIKTVPDTFKLDLAFPSSQTLLKTFR